MPSPPSDAQRATARAALMDALAPLDGVRSVRFVGSYWAPGSRAAPGDVDVVVILGELTRSRFQRCVDAVASLDGALFGFPGAHVQVNDSFGPRKFDAAAAVIVHLMIYDVASHRAHVLASPFTCLDWERVDHGHGPSLRETFPVPALAPPALLAARRGVTDYLEDLRRGALSVRQYRWDDAGRPVTEVVRVPLDERNRGEFAIHVVRHLLTNLAKVMSGRNDTLSDDALRTAWAQWVPGTVSLGEEYLAMVATKRAGAAAYPLRAVTLAIEFAEAFGTALEALVESLPRVVWVRHALTVLNNGRFLGQGRDPSISDSAAVAPLPGRWHSVRSSPARRALETASRLAPASSAVSDARLHEIAYGDAEGLSFGELSERHPALVAGWARGEDLPFPGGEGHHDVLQRLDAVIAELLTTQGNTLVVTHNVVLRVLLGSRLCVAPRAWHKIVVGHLEPIESFVVDGRLVLHLPAERLGPLLDLERAPEVMA